MGVVATVVLVVGVVEVVCVVVAVVEGVEVGVVVPVVDVVREVVGDVVGVVSVHPSKLSSKYAATASFSATTAVVAESQLDALPSRVLMYPNVLAVNKSVPSPVKAATSLFNASTASSC